MIGVAGIDIADAPTSAVSTDFSAAVVGVIVAVENDEPRVSFRGCTRKDGVTAQATVDIQASDIGKSTVLLFESGDRERPIIVGKLQQPSAKPVEARREPDTSVEIDGRRLELSADHEIVLRCGKASITLTRAGKVIVRGAYIINRSSGVNKIKGASVQIN